MNRISIVAGLVLLCVGFAQASDSPTKGNTSVLRDHSNVLSTPASKRFLDAMLANIREKYINSPGLVVPAAQVDIVSADAGFQDFCNGQGVGTVDGLAAARRMTAEEFERCKSLVGQGIVEIKLGFDALALTVDRGAPAMDLSRETLWRALASRVPVSGQAEWVENKVQSWSEIDSNLPDIAISVQVPVLSTGARALFSAIVMNIECENQLARLSQTAEDAGVECSAVRSDVAVQVSAGSDLNSVVVSGYSDWLQNDQRKHRLVPVDGIAPNDKTLASGLYPLGRSYYLYIKLANADKVGESMLLLQEAVDPIAVQAKGYLVGMGLLPLSAQEHKRLKRHVLELWPLDRIN